MPIYPAIVDAFPQSWTIFGHSYWQMAFGTRTQQGRADGMLRSLLYNQQFLNTVNHAQAGTRLSIPGDWGFGRVLNLVKGWTGGAGNLGNTAPYVVGGQGGSGGAYLLGFGMNDIGFNGQTPQNNLAYQHALRTVISRCRMSTLGAAGSNYPGGCGTFTPSGFSFVAWNGVNVYNGMCTGAGIYFSGTVTNSLTFTLPADYSGQTIAFCFTGQPSSASSTTSNVLTFSGTAGVTGTFNTDNILPSGAGIVCPVTVRVKTLTAANAGQTIVITYTTAGSSAEVFFDSWWLEADNAPPVIVCNTARLCDNPSGGTGFSGYTVYGSPTNTPAGSGASYTSATLAGITVASTPATIAVNSSWGLCVPGKLTCASGGGTVTISFTGVTGGSSPTLTGCTAAGGGSSYTGSPVSLIYAGPTDADVNVFNQSLYALIPEFDGMVQVADIDTPLNKAPAVFSFDGLHVNEAGSSKIAQAVVNAVNALQPTSPQGHAANLNPPFPVVTPLARPYVSGQFYTSDTAGGANGSPYTPVNGDMWALPLFWSSGVATWTQWCMEAVASGTATTIFMALYEDRMTQGYPCSMHVQPAASALSLPTTAVPFLSTTTAGVNGYLSQAVDPGLYWLVIKIIAAGTATLRTMKGPSMWVPNLSSAGAGGVTPCGWKLTGQGAAMMTARFPAGASAVDNVPMIGVKPLIAQS
jgi:hypothetical protein